MAGGSRKVDSVSRDRLLAAHMTATEVFESVSNGGASDFADVVGILNTHQPWCLIDGLAVNCYVEPVYTMDVDLVVVATELEPIARDLEEHGFKVKRFEHSMNAQRSSSELSLQFTTDVRFLRDMTECEVLGLPVPVASLENIIRGKVWAWQDANTRLSKRKKDELDLIRIAETQAETRRLMPREIVAQL